jgi:hypothetical protein
LTTYSSLFLDGTSTNNIVQASSNTRSQGIGLWSTGGASRVYVSGGDLELLVGTTLRDQDTPTGGTTAVTITGTTGAVQLASTLGVTGNTTLTGDLAVNGGDITTSATTFNLINTTATTLNVGQAATTLSLGAATGTGYINNAAVTFGNATAFAINGVSPTLSSSSTGTLTLFNTNLTTVNAFGAATTLSIGAATGTLTINNANTVITGNLTVNGTTTTINATTLTVDDKNIELGSVGTPSDVTADGGGITLKGATDKSITWSSLGWTSSEDFNLVTGKVYEINGTSVLSATTLGSAVVTSSLTTVGTIISNSTTPLSFQSNSQSGTYNQTTIYANQNNNNVTFGNLFAHGFKATAVVIVITTAYTFLAFKVLFPDMIDIILEISRKQMLENPKMTDEMIEQAISMTKKFFIPFAIGGTILGTGFTGAIASLIGAAVAKKNPIDPFSNPAS